MMSKVLQRRIISVAFIFLLIVKGSTAQEIPIPKTLADLKSILKIEMENQHVAGMMLTIATKDSVLYAGGLGFSDVDKKIPINENQLFRSSSITKLFVSLGILNLVNDGKLTVNTRIKDIVPDIYFKNEWEATNPITVAELMEHTTGFSDKSPFEEYNFSNKKFLGIESVKVFNKFMVSKWKPGERHSYSNVNYAILAYIIEHVSGKPINEYLSEKVFIPLGMPNANMHLTDDESGEYSKGYVWKFNHFQEVPHQPQFNAGYGSLNMSTNDYSNVLIAYLKNWKTPEGQFLSKEILEDSETPHTYLSAKAGFKNTYAYGNECWDLNGYIFRGHRGAIGGFLSAMLYNRNLGLGYAFSINTHNETFYRFADEIIRQFLLQSFQKPSLLKSYPINETSIEPYTGYFRLSNPSQLYSGFFESLQNTFKLEQNRNELNVHIIGRGFMIWQPADSASVFFKNKNSLNPQIVFLKDSDNKLAITDGTMYFKKISAIKAWGSLLLFAGSTIILISILFYGLINIFLLIFRKIPISQLLVRLSPLFSTIGLLLVLSTIPRLLEHMKDCTQMNSDFIWWTIGKYVFAFFLLYSIFLQIFHGNLFRSRWLKVYLFFTGLAGCYLLVLLLVNHWYF